MSEEREIVKPQTTALDFVESHSKDFAQVLPQHMNADRMSRIALSALRTNPKLAQSSIQSVAISLMACSSLGLEPNTPLGHAYLIPFYNKKLRSYECTLIIGYRGYIELFYRSGAVASVNCTPVFEGDDFRWTLGLNPSIHHIPGDDPRRYDYRRLTHVYPVIRLSDPSADPIWDVLELGRIEAARERSPSVRGGASSPWDTDYIPMAMKTGIRSIKWRVPFSVEKNTMTSEAMAFESAVERGANSTALLQLGEGVSDVTRNMIGDVEDAPVEPTNPSSIDEQQKPKTIDDIAKATKPATVSVPAAKPEPARIDLGDIEPIAQELYGDEWFSNASDFARQHGKFGLGSMTKEQRAWLKSELSVRLDAQTVLLAMEKGDTK